MAPTNKVELPYELTWDQLEMELCRAEWGEGNNRAHHVCLQLRERRPDGVRLEVKLAAEVSKEDLHR